MRILIVGSGLIGVTAAYFLQQDGHDVLVIDRRSGPGLEASFANGALLTPSMSDPWNGPGCWRTLLASLFSSASPLQVRLHVLPSLAGWGVRFLASSSRAKYERNTRANLGLGLYSLELLRALRAQAKIEYGCATRGTLKVFRDPSALARACEVTRRLAADGLLFRRLSAEQTVSIEPGLAPIAARIAGALYFETDETGDAHRFCVALAERARELGVEFRFGAEVRRLQMDSGRVAAVVVGQEELSADRYVMAAGSWTTPLLRAIGVRLPVQPAKGYSMTFDCPERAPPLNIPVIDDQLHAVVVPLEGVIRVAGTAEFAGFDHSLDEARLQNLRHLLAQVLPESGLDPAQGKPWCGLRAMSSDGVPIIGATPVSNLWVSTGHGHLGWTMAAGSAQLLTDLISGRTPSIDPAPFALNRF